MNPSDTMVALDNLHKQFEGRPVLDGITLQIHTGELVALIGESGCGKSVLIKHINALLRPDRGTISVHGRDLSTLHGESLKKLRRNIGMVFQNAALFDSMTIAENMALAAHWQKQITAEQHQEIQAALHRMGLDDIEALYPSALSGGMKKRVAIARALVMKPSLMLYDEPTTGLDPPRASAITQLIEMLNWEDELTSIVVTHDLSRITAFDRVVMLQNGRIHFDGPPALLLTEKDPTIKRFIITSSAPISMEENA